MRVMICGVFFRRRSSATPPAHPVRLDVPLEQLPATLGDRVWIDAQEVRDPGIAALADFERLKSCKEASLALIEQAEEQNDRRFQLVRQHPFAHPLELTGHH